MPIPQNKDELILAIESNYSKLWDELITIPEKNTKSLTLVGHAKATLMSIENLIAYLIGWGELVLKWNTKIENNQTVHFPHENYNWTQLGELAQKFYADYQHLNFKELLEKLNNTVKNILKLIHSKSNEELYQTLWYKNYSMGRMIQLNTSSPYKNARIRIRKWKKQSK